MINDLCSTKPSFQITFFENDPKLSRDKQTDVFVVFDKDEITVEELKAMFSKAIKEKFTIGFSNIMICVAPSLPSK